MRRLVVVARALAIGAILVAVACSRSSPRTDTLERQLAINAEQHGVVGQAVLVMHDDEVVFRGSHGVTDLERKQPVRPEQVFPVFSVAKLFTSTLVYQLVERGDVELKAPIGRYVSDLPTSWQAITIDQLMSHVSGLPDYFEPGMTGGFAPTTREMIASLAAKPVGEPGRQARYNQVNFVLLGALLEAHYGKPFRAIVAERILEPLGLANTYLWRPSVPAGRLPTSYRGVDGKLELDPVIAWPEYATTHAELFTTIDDLAVFVTAVRTGKLVKPETLLAVWKPYRLPNDDTSWSANGWEYETSGDEHRVGHDGGTVVRVRLVFRRSLARDTRTYIYLTNGSAKNVWSRTLVDSLER
jgi:CubicO group peptidase (beta-lactamase class C family)